MSEPEAIAKLRNLCRTDLFFLLVYGCDRLDADSDWVFNRCREVQAAPDGFLDLWAREHYKSTIITFALSLQDILASHGENPLYDEECTIGIFSHTRPIAKQFLRQIKQELERNEKLKRWFPDILYANPKAESPKWSEDEGIVVKRQGNPKEGTVEAWGLVDGQPTSKHYNRGIYDDVVTRESVTGPEMIKKTTGAWELSRALMARGGRSRYIGTRYAYFDTYHELLERGIPARIYAATEDGTADGEPVYMTREELAQKRLEMKETFFAQMLMQPRAEEDAYFRKEWFQWYDRPDTDEGMKRFIDRMHLRTYAASDYAVTANAGDWTIHGIVGVDPEDRIYILDWWRGKTETHIWIDQMIRLAKQYKPLKWAEEKGVIEKSVGPFITKRMRETKTHFLREPIASVGDKPTRGRSIQARASMGMVYLPKQAPWLDDMFQTLLTFPIGQHDDDVDVLGMIGRMLDTMVGGYAPKPKEEQVDKWEKAFAEADEDSYDWKTL